MALDWASSSNCRASENSTKDQTHVLRNATNTGPPLAVKSLTSIDSVPMGFGIPLQWASQCPISSRQAHLSIIYTPCSISICTTGGACARPWKRLATPKVRFTKELFRSRTNTWILWRPKGPRTENLKGRTDDSTQGRRHCMMPTSRHGSTSTHLTNFHTRLGLSRNPMLEALFPLVYVVSFAVIAGGAFALMTQTTRTPFAQSSPRNRHPEAPKPGDEVLYVDLSRERLEYLYEQAS